MGICKDCKKGFNEFTSMGGSDVCTDCFMRHETNPKYYEERAEAGEEEDKQELDLYFQDKGEEKDG